ncbi:MAG TPA: tRNA (cytidine(34)-2'-O)-methyltransferase [Clostridiales bacterium]|nr:tRNA (cytidine(34)-2'-O)-methyltransferase [Clostridiales bacterium]
MPVHIVLVEPEIPQNTGNIARTCAATGAGLHLVKPLGFSIDDRHLKRAGLDYWDKVLVSVSDSFEELRLKYPDHVFYYTSTKAPRAYTEVEYPENCFLVFGKETAGLPESLLEANREYCIRIPMRPGIRSLNLSNSVAIVLYEVLRQHGFKGFQMKGRMESGSLAEQDGAGKEG